MFFQPDSIDLHAHASAINPSHSLYFMLNVSINDALWEKSLSSKSSPRPSTSLKYNKENRSPFLNRWLITRTSNTSGFIPVFSERAIFKSTDKRKGSLSRVEKMAISISLYTSESLEDPYK